MSLFLLPTLCVVGEPPEFLVADINHIASWSEVEGRLSSSPCRKEEMRAAERSSSNSCAVVVPWQRCGERGKRDVYCDKQIGKAVTVLNCMLKGLWEEEGSEGIRKKLKSEYAAYLESKYRRNDGSSI